MSLLWYVGRHRRFEFPDSDCRCWIITAYVGKHRHEVTP